MLTTAFAKMAVHAILHTVTVHVNQDTQAHIVKIRAQPTSMVRIASLTVSARMGPTVILSLAHVLALQVIEDPCVLIHVLQELMVITVPAPVSVKMETVIQRLVPVLAIMDGGGMFVLYLAEMAILGETARAGVSVSTKLLAIMLMGPASVCQALQEIGVRCNVFLEDMDSTVQITVSV